MAKLGWCLVWGATPHICPGRIKSMGKIILCRCPCHIEKQKALEELI